MDSQVAARGETAKQARRIVIVGGVAGGASAAARARRLSEAARITLFERGREVSFANCGLPYHIGGVIAERERLLVQSPEGLRRRYRVDVHVRTEVLGIDREKREVLVQELDSGEKRTVPYDDLLLSPGAEPVRPPIPGLDSKRVFTLRSMADMDAIKAIIDHERPGHAVVIGGGYIGLEMAEALRERKVGVTLVELTEQVMGPVDPEMAAPLHQELVLNGVDLRLGVAVKVVEEVPGGLRAQLSDGQSVPCGMIVAAIGVRPEVTLARAAGLTLGPRGGIAVDEHMRTSDAHIFAVGDAVEVTELVSGSQALIPLAGPANRQGRIAADAMFERGSTYRRTQGTAICKVFNLAVGMTGLSEKVARRLGLPVEKVYVHPASHAGFYPGASPLHLKLLFDPVSGKVLGAQAVGAEGVDKRIDVLAVAVRAGLTVYDLEHLELCYAPPYGSAKDPVNQAGFVAANVQRGDVVQCHASDIKALRPGQALLDVRTPDETRAGAIPGAVCIPLDELRDRLGELSRELEYLVFCQVGLRGYTACRILSQHGFRCRNLSGGYATYAMVTGKPRSVPAAGAPAPVAPTASPGVVKEIDACGLQCPGPVMRLKAELELLKPGQALSILSTDVGFVSDVPAWCRSTGHTLVSVVPEKGRYRATIAKGASGAAAQAPAVSVDAGAPAKNKTIVVFSGDFDRVMAAFVIANGATAMGSRVTLFFTFWGLNVLRRTEPVPVQKTLVERLFGWMMPRGAGKLSLSRMNMAGLGKTMMEGIMRQKNVLSITELIETARRNGVQLVACSMSMDLMGIHREELIDGVEVGGVATYLERAESGTVNLFI